MVELSELVLKGDDGFEVGLLQPVPIVNRVMVPTGDGSRLNVVLSYPNLSDYLTDRFYLNAAGVGRVANRIANGRFRDPVTRDVHQLTINNGENHLHGGNNGWGKQAWHVIPNLAENGVTYLNIFPDGENGYPGAVQAVLNISVSGKKLIYDYTATCQTPGVVTPISMVQHNYWNLDGAETTTDVLGHQFATCATRYLKTSPDLIPESILKVHGTPYDFRLGWNCIGEADRIGDHNRGDFDTCLVLPLNKVDGRAEKLFRPAAELYSKRSGIIMQLYTTEPVFQFYTGGFLEPPFGKSTGLCFEPQQLPDSVNNPRWHKHYGTPFVAAAGTTGFPSSYRQRTVFAFR